MSECTLAVNECCVLMFLCFTFIFTYTVLGGTLNPLTFGMSSCNFCAVNLFSYVSVCLFIL